MSKEAVVGLLEKADTDEALRQELDAAVEAGDPGSKLLTVAEKHGFHFSAEEFGEVVKTLPRGGAELSDDDLGAVAGGVIGDFGMPRLVLQTRTFRTVRKLGIALGLATYPMPEPPP